MNRFAPGNCLTSTTLDSSTPAGPTSTRPGSIATLRPLPRVAATSARTYSAGSTTGLPS